MSVSSTHRPASPAGNKWSWGTVAAVTALLLLHAALALWAVSGKSVTADEILHLAGGYFYNKYGDYRIQPENGNLPQRWAALPAVWQDAPPPTLQDNVYWRTSDASVVGHQFFYETGHDHWPMLMAARGMMTLFSVATGLLIFCWTRRLAGNAAGLFSLSLYALCPNILAHASLVTSDTAAVFFLLASLGAFWRHLSNPTWMNGVLSASVLGLACVAKYSAVLLPPIMAILLVWQLICEPAGTRSRWWRLAPLTMVGHAVGAVAIIWAFYGFRYTGFATGLPAADHYTVPWDRVIPYIGFHGRLVEVCRKWHILPEAFLYGYAWVVQSASARSAFLAGEYGLYGWVSFFPLTFLWKTPLAVLASLVGGMLLLIRRWRAVPLGAIAPLVVLFVVYWGFSLTSHLNIGHRHILPIYPVLFIWLGGMLAPGILSGLWRKIVPATIVLAQLVANVRTAPHYLAFFNTLAGGPANGYRLLVDSSLDWGQDLPGLSAWLATNNAGASAQPVFLSYFGSGEPDYYRIKATRLPFVNGFKLRPIWNEPTAGIYCISATMLQQVYSPVRGEWSLAKEQSYQQGRTKEPLFREYWTTPSVRDELTRLGIAEQFEQTWRDYNLLRFARLCFYLRARQPDAMVGYSILIYRLGPEEIDLALQRPYSSWHDAIQRSGRTQP